MSTARILRQPNTSKGVWQYLTSMGLSCPQKVEGSMQAQGRSVHKLITLLALLPCLALANEQTLCCYVVGMSDGDTLSCFDAENRKTEKIRLRGIDAPEAKQPFGQLCKQSLSYLAHGQPATAKWSKGTDGDGLSAQYGLSRLIALAAVTPWISAEPSYQ